MTYKDAYDKIIQAYFKDEIKPMDAKFCFCGTLSPDDRWRSSVNYPYTRPEYGKMEDALFLNWSTRGIGVLGYQLGSEKEYEDMLFEGMCAALEVLKEIHRSRGEDVDGPELTKRVLVK